MNGTLQKDKGWIEEGLDNIMCPLNRIINKSKGGRINSKVELIPHSFLCVSHLGYFSCKSF